MNPYKTLGVSQDASEDDIKKAFKEKAKKWHPDLNRGNEKEAEEKFKKVNEAYQRLTNKSQPNKSQPNLEDDYNPFADFFNRDSLNSIRNIGYISISLEEVMSGINKTIEIVQNKSCKSCDGVGFKLSDEICPHCKGTGGTQINRGIMRIMTQCSPCQATGKKIESICGFCNGNKTYSSTEKIDVIIPKGVKHGSMIQIKDHYVATITHVQHSIFKRTNNPLNLIQVVNVDWLDSLLGKTLKISTLDGNKKLKLKPIIQQDSTLRMKKSGLVDESGLRGHMFVKVQVNMPKKLSEKQIKLLEEIRRENDE